MAAFPNLYGKRLLQPSKCMKKLIKKVSSILLVLCMALSCLTAIPVLAAEDDEPDDSKMRVGHNSWMYEQMGMHSSPRIGAGSQLGPHKVNTSGEWVWYCLRQKIKKGTKTFVIEDMVDSCLDVIGVTVFLKNTGTEYTSYFSWEPKNNLTIKAKSNVTTPYATQDVTFDFYIVCKFKDTATAEAHGHRSGNNWMIGNKALITMDSLKKSTNFTYIYGNLSPETSTGTNVAKLCYPDGEQYGNLISLSKGTPTFPSVNLGASCIL